MFVQFAVWQLMVHVFCWTLQLVQGAGQLFASPPCVGASLGFGASIDPATMQKPLSQMRPPSQSAFVVHAY